VFSLEVNVEKKKYIFLIFTTDLQTKVTKFSDLGKFKYLWSLTKQRINQFGEWFLPLSSALLVPTICDLKTQRLNDIEL